MTKSNVRIEYLSDGETLFAANVNDTQNFTLSDSEARILLLLKAGKDNAEIAARFGTDQAAVKEHIKSILRKAIGYRNRTKQSGQTPVALQDTRQPRIAEAKPSVAS